MHRKNFALFILLIILIFCGVSCKQMALRKFMISPTKIEGDLKGVIPF